MQTARCVLLLLLLLLLLKAAVTVTTSIRFEGPLGSLSSRLGAGMLQLPFADLDFYYSE